MVSMLIPNLTLKFYRYWLRGFYNLLRRISAGIVLIFLQANQIPEINRTACKRSKTEQVCRLWPGRMEAGTCNIGIWEKGLTSPILERAWAVSLRWLIIKPRLWLFPYLEKDPHFSTTRETNSMRVWLWQTQEGRCLWVIRVDIILKASACRTWL